MKTSIAIHSGLLLLLLGASWKVSQSEEEERVSNDGVTILDWTPTDLKGLTFVSEERSLSMDIEALDNDRYYSWATLTEQKEIQRPHDSEESSLESFPGSGDAAEVETYTETIEETQVFKTGGSVADLLEILAPFRAKRLIETNPSPERLEQWGLSENTRSVLLRGSSGEQRFLLGGATYKTKDRYVQSEADGSVYLLEGTPFRKLDRSVRSLTDKSLLGAKESEIEEIQIRGGEKTLVLEHRNRADRQNHRWVPRDNASNAEPLADWVLKLIRLLAVDYVQPEEVPTNLQPVLEATASTDFGRVDWSLQKGTDPDGDIRWYAKSSYTRALVNVDLEQAATLAGDFESLVE